MDKYVYTNSEVLKNKFDIRKSEDLARKREDFNFNKIIGDTR